MDITYLQHSCFKLKGKNGTVVTDPFQPSIGIKLPSVSADMVTISHGHDDHNALDLVSGTARRPKPFYVTEPGEYEVAGISVFGTPMFHDAQNGAERGRNTAFTVLMDDVRICHLGDLGHELSAAQLEELGTVDVLLCPVGGFFTIDPKLAVKVIQQLEPSYIIPMHFRTDAHSELFAQLFTLADFLKEYGVSPTPQPKLVVEKGKLPEETELVVLSPQA